MGGRSPPQLDKLIKLWHNGYTIKEEVEMPKFKCRWSEIREVVVEADTEAEAYEMIWQGHDEPSTFIKTTDYSMEEVDDVQNNN